LATLAALCGIAMAASPAAAATTAQVRPALLGPALVPNGDGGLCLDAKSDGSNNPNNNGDPVQLWTCKGTANQQWNLNENADSYGTITNRARGKCLDAQTDPSHNPNHPGDSVQLWDCNGGDQQQWEPVPLQNGSYELVNKYGLLVLDAQTDSSHSPTQDGDRVQLWTSSVLTPGNQQWSYDVIA
jgi:hypothetical protein